MSNVGTNLELIGTQFTFDPNRGETLTQVYEGSAEGCIAKGMEIRETRPDLSFVIEPADLPLWRISIRAPDFRDDPASSEVVTTYELLGNDIAKDIYEAPFLNGADQDEILQVKAFFKDPDRAPEITSTDPRIAALFELITNGTTSFQLGQYVFRSTSLVSSKSTIRFGYGGVGLVHDTGQIQAIGGEVPQTLLFTLSEIPMPSVRNASYYHAGWLKKTPTLSQVAWNKYSISQEYWLDSWSIALYPHA